MQMILEVIETIMSANTNQYSFGFCVDEVFQTKECRHFARIWDRCRRGKLMPNRSDIDIEDLAPLVSQVTIIEVRSRYEARVRLVGTSVRDVTGSEVTGQNWIDMAPEEQREERAERVHRHIELPCGSRTVTGTELRSGLVIMTEFAAFPILPNKDGFPPQIIGCFHPLTDNYLSPDAGTGLAASNPNYFAYLDIGAGTP